jgi:hypothetical protein
MIQSIDVSLAALCAQKPEKSVKSDRLKNNNNLHFLNSNQLLADLLTFCLKF